MKIVYAIVDVRDNVRAFESDADLADWGETIDSSLLNWTLSWPNATPFRAIPFVMVPEHWRDDLSDLHTLLEEFGPYIQPLSDGDVEDIVSILPPNRMKA